MTAKYYLTQLYKKGAEINVTINSLEDFLTGKRITLEHIITYEHQSVIVITKPIISNYQNYKPINQSDFFYILPQK